ncbi:MAG: hypothetical protein KC931_11295 [Candidatus Omnitrophica bacterium]|nr:hypothetical protein [Candidatus Omnitrophota bacterium]
MNEVSHPKVELDIEALIRDHFDPDWGSPYWLSRASSLSFDPLEDVHSLTDLIRFGPFPEEDLRTHPASSFVPKKFHSMIPEFIYSETGGTTGKAKGVYFSPSEFRAGFVDPFLRVCDEIGWPRGEKWLFLGPTGPHIIGRVLGPICREMDSPPPFRVDFDPRWSLRLTDRSTAKARYLEHIVEQGLHLIDKEGPRVLFGSPNVLQKLGEGMPESSRSAILAVHYGGTALSPELYRVFREELFPEAIHLSGYGNSLVGVAFEAGVSPEDRLVYFPSSDRHQIRLIPLGEESLEERLRGQAVEGETGQVVVSRLDSTLFIPNLVERDMAGSVYAPDASGRLDWSPFGIYNPRPISEGISPQGALY